MRHAGSRAEVGEKTVRIAALRGSEARAHDTLDTILNTERTGLRLAG